MHVLRCFSKSFRVGSCKAASGRCLASSSADVDLAGRVIVSTSTDPFFNLGVEEVLMQREPPPAAMLYANEPCVVIGRNQNPWKEARMQEIVVVRRRSGGGTVFHDVGNLNWGIFSSRAAFDKTGNADKVRKALNARFGLSILQNERTDLVLSGKKVSGSAYRLSRNALHHGTLLVSADLSSLRGVLHPKVDLEGKWIDSVPAPGGVANLADACPDATIESATTALTTVLSESPAIMLGPDSLPSEIAEAVTKQVTELASYDWNFGATKPFVQRFVSWGSVKVEKGLVVDIQDEDGNPVQGKDLLLGVPYHLPDLERALAGVRDQGTHLSQLLQHFREAFGHELRAPSRNSVTH